MIKHEFTLNDPFALGGIAAGKIYINDKGQILDDCRLLEGVKSPLRFVIKANGRVKTLEACDDGFENAKCTCCFPFYKLLLCSDDVNVKMTAFTPFVALNDTDSGIPAAFFELEVENNADSAQDFTIGAYIENPFANKNNAGCCENGAAYICFSEKGEDAREVCIATDEKNISYCEHFDAFCEFTSALEGCDTLENKGDNASGGAICAHFTIGAKQSHKVKFILSWFLPYGKIQGKSVRSYYANFFDSSREAVSYCFNHYDRLRGESARFSKLVFNSTLAHNVLEEVNKSLMQFARTDLKRYTDGALYKQKEDECFVDLYSFCNRRGVMACLFPRLEYSETEHLYQNCFDDNGCICFDKKSDFHRQLLQVLKSYRKYIFNGDDDMLIEDWYYIVKCLAYFYDEENPSRLDKNADGSISLLPLQHIYSSALYAACKMAGAVKDKKRTEKYFAMHKNNPSQDALFLGGGFEKLSEYCGFEYNAVEKHIGFSPLLKECPLDFDGTFRCPFFTPSGYGYVEQGVDYIEINMVYGSLTVRSFGVPKHARIVHYGGRSWHFAYKDGMALLDSELEVTPQKKLTVLIG